MTLTFTSAWEHSVLGSADGSNHLVVTITANGTTSAQRPPLDLAFALDRSGSMHGEHKLGLVKQAVISASDHLRETDRVALVTFDTEVSTRHYLTPLDPPHRRHLRNAVHGIEAGSSTNLSGGWLEACRQLSDNEGRVARALLLTDGLANAGITNPITLQNHAKELRARGVSTSAIGVGEGFDEILLSGMAEAGGGTFQYIAHARELDAFFEAELKSLESIVAARPYLDIALPQGYRIELVNAFPHEANGHQIGVDLRDLSAGESLELVFQVSTRYAREAALTPQLHLHWSDPASSATAEIDTALETVAIGDASMATRNELAAEIVAVERAAKAHREAARADREGRYEERHRLYDQSAAWLAAAPQSERSAHLQERSRTFAAMSAGSAMPEDARKRSVDEAHKLSRGKSTR